MKKMSMLLRKCRSLSTRLARSSSYTSLRSKSSRDEGLWCDGEAARGGEDEAVVFVGSSRRRYVIRARHLSHPVISALIDRSRQGSADGRISVKCEVVLFDHLLWMLENGDLEVAAEGSALEELAALYAYY